MAPAVTAQIIASMRLIMGINGTDEGQRKIRQLHENTRYFRQKV
jgi:serine palmitoyltransferase